MDDYSYSDFGEGGSLPAETSSWDAGGMIAEVDPIDFYTPFVAEFAGSINDKMDFGDFARSESELSPAGGPKPAELTKTEPGFMDGLRKWMGFGDTPKDKTDFGRGAMTIGAGLLAGAAAGYHKGKQLEIEKDAVKDRRDLMQSQIALNESKTTQKGLENMKFSQGQTPTNNVMNPAKFTPITQRATA